MAVHGKVVGRQGIGGVADKVAGHPVVFGPAGDVGQDLTEVAPVEARAAEAGGGDVGDGEAGVVGHGDESLLAVEGDTLQADLLGIHSGISLQVVEEAARAPGDGAEGGGSQASGRLRLDIRCAARPTTSRLMQTAFQALRLS